MRLTRAYWLQVYEVLVVIILRYCVDLEGEVYGPKHNANKHKWEEITLKEVPLVINAVDQALHSEVYLHNVRHVFCYLTNLDSLGTIINGRARRIIIDS